MSAAAPARRGPDTAALLARLRSADGLVFGLIVVGVLLRTYRLTAPLLDAHAFRQTQTASTVWLFDRFGYEPLHYRVPMFGGGNWVLEFPTYQSLVYGITQVTGYHEWVGRVVSIACYAIAAWLLYRLATRWTGQALVGVLAVATFTFLPLSVFYFRAFMIDPLVIALTLGALLAATNLFERFTWPMLATYGVTLVLAALTKPTIVAALGIPLAVLGVRTLVAKGTPRAGRIALAGIWVAGLVLLVLWNRHTDAVNIRSNGMSYAEMRDWYFGSTFVDPVVWTTVGTRILDNVNIVGLALVALGLTSIPSVRTRYRWELAALAASAFVSIGVFANLNRVHDYYQLPYSVTIALFAGLGGATLAGWITAAVDARAARQAVTALFVALVAVWSINLFNGYFSLAALETTWQDQGRELATHTPDQPVVVVRGGADPNEPTLLYEARRVGWGVPTEDSGQLERILARNPEARSVAIIGGLPGVTPEIQGVLDREGLTLSHESTVMAIFTRPAAGSRDVSSLGGASTSG